MEISPYILEKFSRYTVADYITCLITLAIIFYFIFRIENKKKKRNSQQEIQHTIETEKIEIQVNSEQLVEYNNFEFKDKYQKRYLLTKNEYQEFKKLKQFASIKGLIVCPKVRLLDLVEPRRGDPKHKTLLYKIQSKHVDFVICDQNLYVKAILELDDNSHDQNDRKERDEFVNLILQDVGYTVIRTRSITEETLNSIT